MTKREAQIFRCRMCGECCSSWNIPIDGVRARALLEKPWVQERLTGQRRELIRVTNALYRIPLTDENVCVFLGEDRRCMIEVLEGLEMKPAECRRFPFATVRLPDGTIRHDTSAACKTVTEILLRAFEPIEPHADSPDRQLLDDGAEAMPVRIKPGIAGHWEETRRQQWLEALRPLFMAEAISADSALKSAWCGLSGPVAIQRFEFGRTRHALLPIFFLRKPYGTWSWLELIRGQRYADPRLFGHPVELAPAGRVIWSSEQDQLLKAFLYNLISRHILLATGGSLESLVAMAGVAAILVRWYARMLAALQEKEVVGESEVAMGIRLVERYYTGHQPRFLHLFQSPLRGAVLGRLLFGYDERHVP